MKQSSLLSWKEATEGTHASAEIMETVDLLTIEYCGYGGQSLQGQLIVAKDLKEEIQEIFYRLSEAKFPIEKMIPIVKYNWNDHASIHDNNTSAFNYRVIAGTNRLSYHAFGRAIDINPKFNPYLNREGISDPPGYTYNPHIPGTIRDEDIVVKTFLFYGWKWGGHWKQEEGRIDYQHFEKPLNKNSIDFFGKNT
jgi:hypothetical protein